MGSASDIKNDLDTGDPRRSPLALWFALSIGLHLLVLSLKLASHPRWEELEQSKEPIEIAQVPPELPPPPARTAEPPAKKPPLSREQRIAESEKADNEKLDKNAKFLSDKNQSVEKQTRAKLTDDFRDKTGTGLKGQPEKGAFLPKTGENVGQENDADTKAPSDLEVADGEGAMPKGKPGTQQGVKRDWKTLSLKDLSVDGDGGLAAATDDKLDGIAEGDRTILATREYKYFSYYHRIKELLRQHWKPAVERKLMSIWSKGKSVSEDEMVTRVLVLLDDKGQIQKISRVASCGYGELDEAAVDAFYKAAPFPNPPHGIVEPDGFVRIRWDFILKTEAAPRIQFQGAGGAAQPF